MPVGVPKVPFQFPEEEDATWADVYNRLYHQRFLFLGQEIDSEISNQITGLLVYFSIEDKTRDFYLFINSPGGGVISGLAIFDIMQSVVPEVQTICIGIAASMASFLLVGGAVTKRLAFPHARVMIHQPASDFYKSRTGEFVLESEELVQIRKHIIKVYVQRTGKPFWVISADMERDVFMSATEAQTYGIIDLISV